MVSRWCLHLSPLHGRNSDVSRPYDVVPTYETILLPNPGIPQRSHFAARHRDRILEVDSQGEGYVVMWRHNEPTYRLYISSIPEARFWNNDFVPDRWTVVAFWHHHEGSKRDEHPPDVVTPEFSQRPPPSPPRHPPYQSNSPDI